MLLFSLYYGKVKPKGYVNILHIYISKNNKNLKNRRKTTSWHKSSHIFDQRLPRGVILNNTIYIYIFLFGLNSHKTNKSSVKSDVLNEPKVAIFSFVEGDSEFTSVRQKTIRQLRQDLYIIKKLRSTNE